MQVGYEEMGEMGVGEMGGEVEVRVHYIFQYIF
jgi:hypothetical protein